MSRWGTAFERSGVKTEYTIVEIVCLNAQQERRMMLFLVSVFGVKEVLDEKSIPPDYQFKDSWAVLSLDK